MAIGLRAAGTTTSGTLGGGGSGGGSETGAPGAAEREALVVPAAPSSIWAITVFTATTDPSVARSFATRPPTGEGSSLSALSVAIEASGWSFWTTSPSRTSHLEIVPSATLSPSCGRTTSMSMGQELSREKKCERTRQKPTRAYSVGAAGRNPRRTSDATK